MNGYEIKKKEEEDRIKRREKRVCNHYAIIIISYKHLNHSFHLYVK